MKTKTLLSATIGIALGLGLAVAGGAFAHQTGYGMGGGGYGMMGGGYGAMGQMMGPGTGYAPAWNQHGSMHGPQYQGHGHEQVIATAPQGTTHCPYGTTGTTGATPKPVPQQ